MIRLNILIRLSFPNTKTLPLTTSSHSPNIASFVSWILSALPPETASLLRWAGLYIHKNQPIT